MATAEGNLQLANLLFAPVREGASRYMDAQVQIAARAEQERKQREMMNLKRMQEIQDQQTEAEMRKTLANIQVQGMKDVEKSRADRDDTRMAAAETAQDTRIAAAEKKAVVAAVRAEYAKYKGDKKIKDFGPEDSPDTLYAITTENAAITKRETEASLKAEIENLRAGEKTLVKSADVTKDERDAIAAQVAVNLGGNAKFSDAYETYTALVKNLSPSIAIKMVGKTNPEFAMIANLSIESAVEAKRAAKASAPEFQLAARTLAQEGARVRARASENNLSNLLVEPVVTPPKEQKLDTTKLNTGGASTKAAPVAAAPSRPFDVSNLSLAALYRNRAPIADAAMQFVSAPGRVLDTMGQYGGAGLRGLVTGDYSVPDKGVVESLGATLGNLYPNPYAK